MKIAPLSTSQKLTVEYSIQKIGRILKDLLAFAISVNKGIYNK